MKKTLFFTLILLIISSTFVSADTSLGFDELSKWEYTIDETGTHVLNYNGTEAAVTVPESFENELVVSVYIDNDYIVELTLPNHSVELPEYALWQCDSLAKVNGLENVTSLGGHALSTTIKEAVFSDALDYISWDGLYCWAKEITIPDDLIYDGAPILDLRLERINLIRGSGEPTLSLVDGVLFSGDQKTLLCYPASRNAISYTVPEYVTRIGDNAFNNIGQRLLTVFVPDTVKEFGYNVFYNHMNAKPEVNIIKGSAAEKYFQSVYGENDYKYEVIVNYVEPGTDTIDDNAM